MKTVAKSAVVGLMVAGVLLCPSDLSSCGPIFSQVTFTFPWPEKPLIEKIGILQPSYPRLDLYTAYRQLTTPLTPGEVSALSLEPKPAAEGVDEWLKAREKVTAVAPLSKIDVIFTRQSPTDYVQYTNCLDDAFRSAALTLNARLTKWNHAQVKDWLSAQDLVFANCAGGPPKIPTPTPDPQLTTDRFYQIAAAYFYASRFDEAETGFRQIAGDRTSPWSDLSSYLVARVQIRRSTMHDDSTAMAKAQVQLQAILNDSSRKAVHSQSRALLEFVSARLNPPARLTELGRMLIKPDPRLNHDLTDYRFLFDKLEFALPPNKDELTDWLYTFHHQDAAHAVAVWRAKHGIPWLLASVVSLQAGNATVADVVQAADEVRPDSLAYFTAAFHAIRLEMAANPQQARTRLDRILQDPGLNQSDRNLFDAERLKVAANSAEFLKYAQRVPVGAVTAAELAELKKGRTTLDVDGSLVLNEHTPLKLIAEAAIDETLSPGLRTNIAMAAWTRAVLFGNETVALQMAPLFPILSGYAGESDKDRRLFAAVLLMLKYPGLHPYADTGFGRTTEVNKIDDYRDNWWCSFAAKQEGQFYNFYRYRADLGPLKLLYPNSAPQASFLSPADQATGDAEWKKLSALPAAPTYLSAEVVKYAQAHLEDARVPEALALAVRSTRFGCTDSGTGKVSKQAYDLLHAKFPRSGAAAITKFWYK